MVDYINVTHGSVKDVAILDQPTDVDPGVGDFIWRPRYSIFDWNDDSHQMPMPDGVELDNRPIALQAAFNFEMLQAQHIPVCYLGTVDSQGGAVPLERVLNEGHIPDTIRMRIVNVVRPTFNESTGEWDYSIFEQISGQGDVNNYMEPIEFIWRDEIGESSSFWRNVDKGLYKPEDFKLPADFKPGDKLPFPILDHSSKYEEHDRYVSPAEAQEMAQIYEDGWRELSLARGLINNWLSRHALQRGFHRPDGKQEFAVMYDEGAPVDHLADVAGTFHEDRFIYTLTDGTKVKVSKQIIRDLNKLANPEWAKQCVEAKDRAEREGIQNWRDLVTARPDPLEADFFVVYNELMRSAANQYVDRKVFEDAPSLETAALKFHTFVTDYKNRLNAA